jgi:hypothetical protein
LAIDRRSFGPFQIPTVAQLKQWGQLSWQLLRRTPPLVFAMAVLGLAGLIQSVSQAPWPQLGPWAELGGLALALCLTPPLLQPIST